MRKKKNIFMIVFTLLLLVMSSSFVFLSGKAHTSVKENIQVHPVLEREMKLFVLSIVQEVDDSYQLLSFDESVSDEDKKQNYVRRERRYGSLSRSFDISGIEADKITASYENGVLTLELPKKAESQPAARQVEIH